VFGGLEGLSLAFDPAGNVLFAGNGAIEMDSGGEREPGDAFLVKLDASGEIVWSRVFHKGTANASLEIRSMAVDNGGHAVLEGMFFASPADFGAGPLAPAEGGDIFVAKFDVDDVDGSALWSRAAGGFRSGAAVAGIAVGPNDEIAVTAQFDEAATFGAPSDRDAGTGNVLVVKLDSDGTPAFVRRAGRVRGVDVAIDGQGNVIVTGDGSPEGVPDAATENQPVFVLEYDPSGRVTRYLSLTGDGVYADAVATNRDAGVFVVGHLGEEATAGSRTVHGAGAFDFYVGRLER
jgi:hypothetical protein